MEIMVMEIITLSPRQDRGEALKRRGEAEASLLSPPGEASASRHSSLTFAASRRGFCLETFITH